MYQELAALQETTLSPGSPYTIKFYSSPGIFYPEDLQTYLNWYLQNSARSITVVAVDKYLSSDEVYISFYPIQTSYPITPDYMVETINNGIKQWAAQYTPQFAMSNLSYSDISRGDQAAKVKADPMSDTMKTALTIGGITLVAAVGLNAILRR